MENTELNEMLDEPDVVGDTTATPEFGTDGETEETTEVAETQQVETEETQEVSETESQVGKMFDEVAGTQEQRVPLKQVTKLRTRAQTAEARVKELEAQQTEVENTDVISKLADMIEDDGEYVNKDELKKVVSELPAVMQNIAAGAVNTALDSVANQGFRAKAAQQEVAFKKDHPDFDQVVGVVANQKLISVEELTEVAKSENVAEAYYNLAQKKLVSLKEALGIEQVQKTTTEPTGDETVDTSEEFASDDDAFEAMLTG